MPKRPIKCKRCGEPIAFIPAGGFTPRGQKPKYIVINPDDGHPHWRRCQVTQDLQKNSTPPARRQHTALEPLTNTREMFQHGTATT